MTGQSVNLCGCGCGNATNIQTRTDKSAGYIKGQPMKFIHGHSTRLRHGVGGDKWNGGRTTSPSGYVQIRKLGEPRIYEHVLVAERALGRKLPPGAQVHHVNELRGENRNNNLVICESGKYHKLLHRRMDAYRETGNPNARKCQFCKEWGIDGMKVGANGVAHHRKCENIYRRQRKSNHGIKT